MGVVELLDDAFLLQDLFNIYARNENAGSARVEWCRRAQIKPPAVARGRSPVWVSSFASQDDGSINQRVADIGAGSA